MNTAKRVDVNLPYDWAGEARLYQVDPPIGFIVGESRLSSTEYVVVSASVHDRDGPETLIFPAKENGEVVDWYDIKPGSFSGGMDIEKALSNAGYTVVE